MCASGNELTVALIKGNTFCKSSSFSQDVSSSCSSFYLNNNSFCSLSLWTSVWRAMMVAGTITGSFPMAREGNLQGKSLSIIPLNFFSLLTLNTGCILYFACCTEVQLHSHFVYLLHDQEQTIELLPQFVVEVGLEGALPELDLPLHR